MAETEAAGQRILAVINQKGGTGKTTTALNLGAALAELGKKILLADLDPQGHLTYSLGLEGKPGCTLADSLAGNAEPAHCITHCGAFDVMPGGSALADVELALGNAEDREYYLRETFQSLDTRYDWVIIDCPPSLSLLSINAFAAATHVLVPMQLEVLALNGLQGLRNTLEGVRRNINPSLEILGVVAVMFDPRRKLSHELLEVMKADKELYVFETHIRPNVKLAEAPSFGQSIIDYDSSSNGAADYRALASEFLKRAKFAPNKESPKRTRAQTLSK